ncbi:type II secretion system F family protein, partial [Pseudomonas aeruginosa]
NRSRQRREGTHRGYVNVISEGGYLARVRAVSAFDITSVWKSSVRTQLGGKTGALPPMLDRAAQTLSRDIERRAMGMTALLEPLMIVVMGGVVLTIVMAVLMPIIEMNQLVQ